MTTRLNRILLFFVIITLNASNGIAQDEFENTAPKYQFGVDIYHGTPMFFQWAVKNTILTDLGLGYRNKEVRLGGPFGARVEYNVNDEFSIGLDVGFNSVRGQADRTELVYNPFTNTSTEVEYNYKFKSSKVGAVITFNVRLYETANFQATGVVGIGYGIRRSSSESDNPLYDPELDTFVTGIAGAASYPVSFRVGFITRYYFTDNIGVNLGLGIGQGGLLNGGLSYRM